MKLKLINPGYAGTAVEIPMIGLGVWQASSKETLDAIAVALKNGYRHIDTACLYGNEAAVGKAVRESGIPRDEIFVTTKLWNSDHGYKRCMRAFETSLRELGLDYVDLYLVHSPLPVTQRLDTWKAMEQILKSGKAKSIGVSNYGIHHLEELFANCQVRPSCNQVELHPFNTRTELGKKFGHRGLLEIAGRYRKSPAQILIRWCLQKNFAVLPKSITPSRIIENVAVFDFEISKEDMEKLDSFDENFITGWDPTTYP